MSNKVWYSFASSAPAGNKVYLCHDDVYISCMGEFVWQNKTKAKATKKKKREEMKKKTAARTASHHKGTRAPEYSIINRWATLATYQTDFRSLIFRFRGNLEFCYNFFFLFFFLFYFLPSSSHTFSYTLSLWLALRCRFVNQYACSPST